MLLRVVLLISLLLPFFAEAQEGSFENTVWRLAAKVRRTNAKIVVYRIEAPPQHERLAKKLRCKLEEALGRMGMTVLTRDLDNIIAEQKMQRSAMFDRKTMAKIGRFANANAILSGQLLSDANGVELHLQLVDIESGQQLVAASDKIPQIAFDKKLAEESPAYQNGHVFRERREWKRAIDCYNRALIEDGEFSSFYLCRAICYFRLNQHDEALCDYNKAIELEPKLASAYNWRGMLYAACRDDANARIDYEQAIQLDPGKEPLQNNFLNYPGECYFARFC